MAVNAERVTVETTAVALNAADADSVSGVSLVVLNGGETAVNVGGSDVTSETGFELAADDSVTVDLASGEVLYAISASSATVHVLRTGA